jgi:hypothetical protein
MLPLSRKSVEPMAARVDPMHASARHQALHHFVANAPWSDEELLRRVCQWVVPKMDFTAGGWWIIDDTGLDDSRHKRVREVDGGPVIRPSLAIRPLRQRVRRSHRRGPAQMSRTAS